MVYLPSVKLTVARNAEGYGFVTEDGKESGKGGSRIDEPFACPSRYGIPLKQLSQGVSGIRR